MYGDTVASRETVVHLPAPITQPHAVIALAVYLPSALKAACCIDDSSLAIRHHNFGFPPLSAEASGISVEIPCKGNTRPSHRKRPVRQTLRYLTSPPGCLGEGSSSLSARDRVLSSEEGCSENNSGFRRCSGDG